MNIPVQKILIPGLAALCGLAALLTVPAFHLSRPESGGTKETVRPVSAPGLSGLDEASPSMREVAAKHLFVPQRKATGQNAFPDLAVKGIFLGAERSAVFSLKSKPQVNLRIWEGGVESALSQIKDPRDPRQPIAVFLREWDIKEIRFDGVTVSHFITGEVETYTVDYTPQKKVVDDAARGYGQGIIPQDGGGRTEPARAATGNRAGQQPASPQAGTQGGTVADRISSIMQQMTPDQRRQFLQRLQQNAPATGQRGGSTPQQPAAKSGSRSLPNSRQNSQQTPDRRR